MDLEQKKRNLHKASMGLMEKKMLRKAIESMGHIALPMGCMPHQMIINISLDVNGSTRIEISNSVNPNTLDVTHAAKEMEASYPLFAEMVTDILKIVTDMADFWQTEPGNIGFIAWLDGEIGSNKLEAIIKPKKGFPDSEYLNMTKD